jgi:hypothetical protein
MAYVAVSRARLDARVYTDSAADLSRALARRTDKTMALDALKQVASGAGNDNKMAKESTHTTQHENILRVDPGVEGDDNYSVERLKGRAILAESNVAVAQKRLNDFEKTKHLYGFDINEEKWSLVRLDRQQRIKEHQIDYSKRAISAYRRRLYGVINNPLRLYGLRGHKENAANAKTKIEEARGQIEDLHSIRQTVNSSLEQRRDEFKSDLVKRDANCAEPTSRVRG